MGAVDSFIRGVEELWDWMHSGARHRITDFVDIETADNETTLVSSDGTMLSIVNLNGISTLGGTEEFQRMIASMSTTMNTSMSRGGHLMQVVFSRDIDGVDYEIETALTPSIETMKRLGMDMNDLNEEKVRNMSRWCARESCYIGLWTRVDILGKRDVKRASKAKMEFIKQEKPPTIVDGQDLLAVIPEIRDRHASFVRSFLSGAQSSGLSAALMEVHEGCRAMRMSIDPEFTSHEWSPSLPGDKIQERVLASVTANDVSEILWAPLKPQIAPRDAENLDMRHVRVGDRIYAPMSMARPPSEPRAFSRLFSSAMEAQIPWRISFVIEPGGIKALSPRHTLTSLFSWASNDNKLFNRAYEEMRKHESLTSEPVTKMRVSFCTWAPEGQMRLLRSRASLLARSVETWGSCEIREISGDPLAGFMSSTCCTTRMSVAEVSAVPLAEAIRLLPFMRPASPWGAGAVLFRTPDGKLMPYQPGSSQQSTAIDLIFARPGSGKSVLMNMVNNALCLSPGLKRLPRIAIIDIGPSSKGLVSLIKEALPDDKKHLATYHRLRMTKDFAINPLDTQLGCRTPTPLERSFLVNFMTLLATAPGQDRPYDGITDLAGMVIDEVYKYTSYDGVPHVYSPGICLEADALIDEYNYKTDRRTSWWDIVDMLAGRGKFREAKLAQRYAVPVMADVAAVCRIQQVTDIFGNKKIDGESLVDAFDRMISSAVREYPIISEPTRFDLGDARVVSLDLDEVARSGGDAANRQTAAMYMLARQVLAKDFYLTEENIQDMPKEYREYHRARILEIREDVKRICMDEFHRTGKSIAVRDQVLVDMREGRKWGVQISLASQSIEDFDRLMVEFSTSIFVMDGGDEKSIQSISETFGLNETAKYALRHSVHGPKEGGATFLARFALTTGGQNIQLLTSTLGPIELWAFSTTPCDALIRNRLYEIFSPKEARQRLAKRFPAGSAAKEVELRRIRLRDAGDMSEKAEEGVIDQIVSELVALDL